MKSINKDSPVLSILAFSIAMALAAPVSYAEEEESPKKGEENEFERIIVIGNVQKKLIEASVPYTEITEEDLIRQAPRNVADVLTNIPSMQIENTSGNTNNEFRFRGVGAGGTQFLEFEEDGIPIFRDAPDFLYRVNNGIAGVDTIRGGNSPILRTAAIGAVVNFRYKEPNMDEAEGDLFVQGSDFGMKRVELWTAGPITDNLGYSIAGYYTTDDGVREVEFTGNEGHNIYGALKYEFDDGSGYLKLSARSFNENNVVYLGVPVTGDIDDPDEFPGGPDINDGSLLSNEIALSTTFRTPFEPSTLDLRDGNASEMHYVGTEFKKEWDLDSGAILTVISRNRYTDISSRFSGYYAAGFALGGDFQSGESLVVNMLNTNTQGAGLVNYSYAFPSGFTPSGFSVTNQQGEVLDQGTVSDVNDNGVIDPEEANSTATTLANENGVFLPIAAFDQDNPAEIFQQDLELNLEFDTDNLEHYMAVGYYYLDQDRSQVNRQQLFLTDLQTFADRVDVNISGMNSEGTEQTVALTDSGFLTHNHWLNQEDINDTINAYYFNYEIKWDNLTVDAGIRHDRFENIIMRANTVNYFGDAPNQLPLPEPGTLVSPAVTAIQKFDGSFRTDEDFKTQENSWTVGGNYVFTQFEDDFAVYGRYTEGSLPKPGGSTNTDVIELGARYDNGPFSIAANYFKLTQDGDVQERSIVIGDESVVARFQTDRESQGIEIESRYNITDSLKVTLSGTYQEPEFQSGGSATAAPGSDVTQEELDEAVGDLTNIDGNQIANQPEWMANLGIEYEMEITDYGYLLFTTTGRYVDRVPFDDANTNYAPSYVQVNFGMNFESLEGDWYGRLNVQNAFDEEALQRVFGGPQSIVEQEVSADGYYSRPLLGRNIVFGVGYRF